MRQSLGLEVRPVVTPWQDALRSQPQARGVRCSGLHAFAAVYLTLTCCLRQIAAVKACGPVCRSTEP